MRDKKIKLSRSRKISTNRVRSWSYGKSDYSKFAKTISILTLSMSGQWQVYFTTSCGEPKSMNGRKEDETAKNNFLKPIIGFKPNGITGIIHLYPAGQLYILSSDLAMSIVEDAKPFSSFLESEGVGGRPWYWNNGIR